MPPTTSASQSQGRQDSNTQVLMIPSLTGRDWGIEKDIWLDCHYEILAMPGSSIFCKSSILLKFACECVCVCMQYAGKVVWHAYGRQKTTFRRWFSSSTQGSTQVIRPDKYLNLQSHLNGPTGPSFYETLQK